MNAQRVKEWGIVGARGGNLLGTIFGAPVREGVCALYQPQKPHPYKKTGHNLFTYPTKTGMLRPHY